MPQRKIIIPKINPSMYLEIQEGFCSESEDRCLDLVCKNCLFSGGNLKHFARFFQLDEIHGEIEV